MSWKATAYVKDLREGLSVTDKFVLLILAEYHNTEHKSTWPSIRTLADDCLMTERGVQQIMARLEANGFIKRTAGCGRGNVSGYQIGGVDYKKGEPQTTNVETPFVETSNERVNETSVKGERNPAQPAIPYKERTGGTGEPVIEPVSVSLKRFQPPTLEEVTAYCNERNNSISPQQFIDYHEARGWKLKGNVAMKSWKATVRTWEQHEEKRHDGNKTAAQRRSDDFDRMAERAIREVAHPKNQPSTLFERVE